MPDLTDRNGVMMSDDQYTVFLLEKILEQLTSMEIILRNAIIPGAPSPPPMPSLRRHLRHSQENTDGQ